jgi:hypothetical protein
VISRRHRPGLIGFAALAATLYFACLGSAAEIQPRHQLLVYYGNETPRAASESPNYTALLSILRQSPTALAATLLKGIEDDARNFPEVVQRDVDALLATASRLRISLAVFTNAMALQQGYLFYSAIEGRTEKRVLSAYSESKDPILATSPLSRPDVFARALADASALFPPDSVDMVLITNSHGSANMALMPRVNVDVSRTTPQELLARLASVDDEQDAPAWAVQKGTDKAEYWRAVAAVSATRGVRFPLIFREACDSGLANWAEFFALPPSVARIAHSAGANLAPRDIDYATIFAPSERPTQWISQLELGLQHRGVRVHSRFTIWIWPLLESLGSIPMMIYFVPLAGWLCWFGVVAWRRYSRAVPEPAARLR